ncbi:MAG: T9SS type A sorting domain-containing protein [Bacteroidetes bacterium]|nr:T9SS type A sorting domain-containing protein [Bacteroidota bacterium]
MKKIFTLLCVFALGIFGVYAQTVLLSEDFSVSSDTTPPSGWDNVQYYTSSPTTDYWHFDNPGSRSPSGGFSGKFAIYDSDNYSNNGALEDIGLETPTFSTIGYDSLFISFDFATEPSLTNRTSIYIDVFDGEFWKTAKAYIDTTTSGQRDTFDISSLARNDCNIKIRFRYYCQSGGWFAVDNIKVYSPNSAVSTNVQLISMTRPLPTACADPFAQVNLRVKNAGIIPASNIPFYVDIDDGNYTQHYTYTFTSTLSQCADTVIILPDTINVAYDSAFDFTIYSALSGDNIKINSDTIYIKDFKNLPSPLFYPDIDSSFCGHLSMIDSIPISGNQTAKWYKSLSDSLPIYIGPKINLGILSKDSILYLETGFKEDFRYPSNSSAPLPSSAAFAPPTISGSYIDITAKTDIYVDSLEVVVRTDCMWKYEIYTTNGSYVPQIQNFSAWTLAYKGKDSVYASRRNKIYIGGIKIKRGETIGFHIFDGGDSATSSGVGLSVGGGTPIIYDNPQIKTYASHYTQQSAGSPGTVIQVLSAYGYHTNVYYRVECPGSFSKRTYRKPVDLPETKIQSVAPFDGKSGLHRDTIMSRKPMIYEMEAPKGYSNSDFGTKWVVTGLDFETVNGTPVPAAHYSITNNPPSPGNNLRLTYTPTEDWVDSLVNISVAIKNTDIYPYCDTVINRQILVTARPEINISYVAACQNNQTIFSNLSTISHGSVSYFWDFDNGETSILTNPIVVFKNYGSFDVKLTITNNYNLQVDTTFTVTIKEKPNVLFTSDNNLCAGLDVHTKNNSIYNSGSSTYLWKFGDGRSFSTKEPIIKYNKGGVYPLRLIVYGDNGCSDSLTQPVNIYFSPAADFMVSSDTICIGEIITFDNTTILDSGTFFSNWKFGNAGTSSAKSPQFSFANGGTYNVKLLVYTPLGCRDSINKNIEIYNSPNVDFSILGNCSDKPIQLINNSSISNDTIASYVWDLNFESQSSDKNTSYISSTPGVKTFILTVKTNKGCVSSLSKTQTVSQSAKAKFDSDDKGCAGKMITFTNTTSPVPGTINYKWNFGDGDSMTLKNANHTYSNTTGQNFNVALITNVNGNCPDTATKQIYIGEMAVCSFNIENDYLPGHRAYKFVPDRNHYVTYDWDFGDGTTSNEVSPIHQYTQDGNYSIELHAVTADNCECTLIQNKSVVNLGVNQFDNNAFIRSYPNPASDIIHIEYTVPQGIHTMNIVDYTGKQVKMLELGKNNISGDFYISVADLASGVYFIKAETNNGIMISRFVISK